MSGFDSRWLALREPHDARARSLRLSRAAARAVTGREGCVVDLGCGTGSSFRHLAPYLLPPRPWLFADDDATLLDEALTRCGRLQPQPALLPRRVNLAQGTGFLAEQPVALVTASALLDLVSAAWTEALARACRDAGAVVLAALSYDGRMELTPGDADDAFIRDAVNRHQRGDKGFGPALGPDAQAFARAAFGREGFAVDEAASDWLLGADDAALLHPLVAGWAQAAAELLPAEAARAEAWRARRGAAIDAGLLRVRVGHHDLLAVPR